MATDTPGNLFAPDPEQNLLPYDGVVRYFGKIMLPDEALFYYEALWNRITWKNDEAVLFGKRIITARKVAWYADGPFAYTYSGTTKQALPWTPELSALKEKAEQLSGTVYNSCLLNLYHNGKEGMAWHSDDEKTLVKNGSIASLSFGAERKFAFKHKRTAETRSLLLENGGLLVMKDSTQTHWLHRLPPSTRISSPRINLTFRTMLQK